jgi:1-acylglycerone phosphate reductase
LIIGLQVLATARTKEKISSLKNMGITTLALDVDSAESIAQLKSDVERITSGKLDYLVNNAGRNYTVPATDLDIAEVEATFRTNVFAVMMMCKAFAPLLIEAQGTIVQIGSLAGVMPYVFGSAYNASKAALYSYTNTLRLEMKPFNVKVLTIVTGGVKSNIARVDRELPADSIYLPINAEYQRRTKHSQEVGMPNEAYAKSVVASVLGAGKGRRYIWQGHGAWLVWFATRFLPAWVLVCFLISNPSARARVHAMTDKDRILCFPGCSICGN